MRVALVIGHKPASPGAVNPEGRPSEYDFNKELATKIKGRLDFVSRGDIEVKIVTRQPGIYRELPDKINVNEPDFIVSLHVNGLNTRSTGTEVLYYHTSESGRLLAQILQDHLVAALGLRDRGIKPRDVEQRGGYLLRYTRAPAVIAEPFFIDNDNDLAQARDRYDDLVSAYADAICVFAGTLQQRE